jgi:hypothetical protein
MVSKKENPTKMIVFELFLNSFGRTHMIECPKIGKLQNSIYQFP